jgi:hypothetical protein
MTTSRHHLTLIDLMATVAAAALGMVPLVWDPPPRAYLSWSSSSGSSSRRWRPLQAQELQALEVPQPGQGGIAHDQPVTLVDPANTLEGLD